MKGHIRHIARRRKGIITERENIVEKQSISIGRATDQDIFLPDTGVSYHHARINLLPDGVVSVTSVSRLGFYIEGNLVQNCLIRNSGQLTFGANLIDIVIDRKQDQVDITIEKLAEDIVEMRDERRLPIKLEQTWFSKRQWSWIGFVLVLTLFLGLPMAAFHDPDAARTIEEFNLPDDDLWLSGAVSDPHRYFATDCNACHQQPFVRVRDDACLDCHGDLPAHSDPGMFDLDRLHVASCAECHREHEGDDQLVQRRQSLCSDCHGFLGNLSLTDLDNITDFGIDHSEFRVTLIPGRGASRLNPAAWRRVGLDDPSIRHETGLVFPHDLHLDRRGIKGPDGNRILDCADCHRTDVSGNYMVPVTMEAHCQSCHRLEFDPADPGRELPHSDLKNLRKMLDEYYSLAALRGGVADPAAPDLVTQRRRPGKPLTRAETDVALKWALQKAEIVAAEVVEFRSCNLCHKVERDPSAESGWAIPEVNTAQGRWLPKGFFAHDLHRGAACESCHAASDSAASEEVLLPGIAVCRECHGGEHADKQLQSTCIECHNFHQPDDLLTRITAGGGDG